MFGAIILLICDTAALVYLAMLIYRAVRSDVKTGDIRFYSGLGPVLIPIKVEEGYNERELETQQMSKG